MKRRKSARRSAKRGKRTAIRSPLLMKGHRKLY